jgi:orotate phosphoribosyltransferase
VSQTRLAVMPTVPSRKEQLARFVVEKSFHVSDVPTFPLASGILSRYYIDCKIALSYPEFRNLMGELIAEQISATALDAVGGLALGAYPIAVSVSDAFYRNAGSTIRAFVVRKEAKTHGLRKHIEGDVVKGDRVLIVDDVITSGKSTVDAIIKARDEGLTVIHAIALIDRQESNGAERIRECGVTFSSLITLQDLVDVQSSL